MTFQASAFRETRSLRYDLPNISHLTIKIIPAAYNNTAKRIPIPDLAPEMFESPSILPMQSHRSSSAVSVGETSDSDFIGSRHDSFS
jgi:hypothetical protein